MVLFALVAASVAALIVHLIVFRKQQQSQVGLILLVPTVILIFVELIFSPSFLVHLFVIGTAALIFAATLTRGTRRAPKFRRALLAFWCFMIGLFIITPLALNAPTVTPADPNMAVPMLSDNALKALVVTPEMTTGDNAPRCSAKNFKYNIPSRKNPEKNGRQTADAISTPIKEGESILATVNDLRRKICEDPNLGSSVVVFLLRQDPRLVEVNPWMERFVDPESVTKESDEAEKAKAADATINNAASYFIEHQDDPTPSASQRKEMERLEAEWRKIALHINALLGHSVGHKVYNVQPAAGLHLTGSAPKVRGLRAIGTDDTLTSNKTLRFVFPGPDGNGCELAIGFEMNSSNPVRLPCS